MCEGAVYFPLHPCCRKKIYLGINRYDVQTISTKLIIFKLWCHFNPPTRCLVHLADTLFIEQGLYGAITSWIVIINLVEKSMKIWKWGNMQRWKYENKTIENTNSIIVSFHTHISIIYIKVSTLLSGKIS